VNAPFQYGVHDMSWNLDEIENSLIVNEEFKNEYEELFAEELDYYEDGEGYPPLEQNWEGGMYINDEYKFLFNADHMEWITTPFLFLTKDERFLELARKHKINGNVIYADTEGDNRGTYDQWEFKDGELLFISGKLKDLFKRAV
jgi:hypothetical protein